MATVLLVLVVVLVIGGLVFGVVSLISGDDPGLVPAEPDERARPLPNDRSLREEDLKEVRFDVVLRGYRMGQVDRMLRRTAYDLGYKDEMIAVLEAEVAALREGRREDADLLRKARESAASPSAPAPPASAATWAPEPAADADATDTEATDAEAPDIGASGAETADAAGSQAPDARASADGVPAGGVSDVVMSDVVVSDAGPAQVAAEDELASPHTRDRTDGSPVDEGPDLPREGSLRRREPVVADAVAGADGTGTGTGTGTVDVADRPAHA